MGNLFKRSMSEELFFEIHQLEMNEVIIKSWVAATIAGGIFSKHGGNLVLTNKRVLFEPLKILGFMPGAKYILPFAEKQGSSTLSEIARAEAVPGMYPRLRLVSKQSLVADFFVSASRLNPIIPPWSSKHKKIRDEAVEEINRAISQIRPSES